jgi:ferrous iron transport protein B
MATTLTAPSRPETRPAETLVVCLAGNPNVGKSSLFNALTGATCDTGNASGITTEACALCRRWCDRPVEVVDLPGTYALEAHAGDQRVARRALLETRPDVVVAVVDATNLARNLYLVLQLQDMGFRVVVALNLVDEAKRRDVEIDVARLSLSLAVPVVPTVAPRGTGLAELREIVLEAAAAPASPAAGRGTFLPASAEDRIVALETAIEQGGGAPFGLSSRAAALAVLEGDGELAAALEHGALAVLTADDDALPLSITKARHAAARAIAAACTTEKRKERAAALWRLTTTARTGVPILIVVVAAMFATLFVVGEALSRLLTGAWDVWVSPAVTAVVTGLFGDGVLGRTILWGVDGGILATLAVGIPYILTFYFILAFVEDSGYMNAAAFLSDRVMHRFGLHGRAVIPLIAAGGCNVPAVIGTRSLSTMRERVIAATLSVLMPCSARTAVIIGAVAAFAGWQWALLVYGITFVIALTAGLALNRMLPGEKGTFVMEMFPFRRPVLRQVARKTWRRFREFVWDAAPIILLGSMALGLLYETGFIWRLTEPLAPVVEGWLMLPAVAGLTLIFAVLRKELALQLLLAFAAVSVGGAVTSLDSFMTTPQIVTYAIVNTIYIPCLATIAVLGRELGWKRTAYISAGTVVLALLAGGLITRLIALAGG